MLVETGGRRGPTLFLLGFLTLFLELALIRYLAGSIWNLGYFPNLVLIAVFVGMGSGFVLHHRWDATRSNGLFTAAPWFLFGLIGLVSVLHPTLPGFDGWKADLGGDLYFTASRPSAGALEFGGLPLFAAWFIAVVGLFFLVSQRTAKVFRAFEPIRAYTLDIAGSCAGVIVFMAMSALRLPAWSWFQVVAVLFVAVSPLPRRWFASAGIVMALMATVLLVRNGDAQLLTAPTYDGYLQVLWSPYQKLEYIEEQGTRLLFVNGVNHQEIASVARPGSYYGIPYEVRAAQELEPYREVLVLGAGTGNDVAAALAAGARHVDAVEIDPGIAALGRAHHPDRPYADPRVDLHIADGRAFLTETNRRYDLIVFALTDSLVKVSPMSQLRLENYLFTVESFERAAAVLSPAGDLLFYNYYREPWLETKLRAMIREATGSEPRELYRRKDFAMLAAANARVVSPGGGRAVDLARDDWPFLYLRERGIPPLYLVVLGVVGTLVVLMLAALRRRAAGRREGVSLSSAVAFLAMGMAFLLLETKSTIQFSLLFGTTWLTNSLVFLGVLVLVLAANLVAIRLRAARLGPIYALLIGSSLAAFVLPLSSLLEIESPTARFVVASVLTFSPIFFANLIFSLAFRDQDVPEHVFGWNLIGATLGGLLEYSSMVLGYRNLAIVVVICYTIALFALRGRGRRITA